MRILIYIFVFLASTLASCSKETVIVDPPGSNDTTKIVSNEPFKNVPELTNMILYEINMRSFSNDGNFNSITLQLDSIKALGVNVIWLMPIFPVGEEKRVGTLGSPYSVQNYTEVNPEFGTLADLKKLVSSAHKHDMAVILDWVANHTAWDNAWIENKDWYTQDADGNIVIPAGTNWQDVADLNYTNTEMRLEMIKSMKYWVTTANIDGFRCDAADFVPYSFWKQAIDSLHNMQNRKFILLAEGSRTDHYSAGFQMTYAWDFYGKMVNIFGKNESASNIFSVNTGENNQAPAGKCKLRYITNHDEYAWTASPVSQYGNEQGTVAAFVATAFMSTVPLIYAGQEIAYPNTISFFDHYPLDWTLNPGIKNQYKKVMQIRANIPAARTGNVTSFTNSDIIAFKRSVDTSKILVLVNVRNKDVSFPVPASEKGASVTDELTGVTTALPDAISLKAYEYKIYKY